MSIGQESTLSPILSALYIALTFHIFEKRSINFLLNNANKGSNIKCRKDRIGDSIEPLPMPTSVSQAPKSFLLFIDDSFFISQEKSYEKLNTHLFCSYNIISTLFDQFRLTILPSWHITTILIYKYEL